jgi:endonuclease YncB( thermonuclease family)
MLGKILFIVLLFAPMAANAESPQIFPARVIRVLDGDTIDVVNSNQQRIRIRLTDIDAPEHNQPFGNEARIMLASLLSDKDIMVVKTGMDRNGRTLGHIFPLNADINLRMVRNGAAWAYRDYNPDAIFIKTERKARKGEDGLWNLPKEDQISPWDWRHNKTPKASEAK